jgi:porin
MRLLPLSNTALLRGLLVASIALQQSAFAQDCEDCDAPAIAAAAVYTGEAWRNASGGLETGNRYLDNLDLTLEVDGGRAFGLEGVTLFAYALYNNGHVFSDELVGSAQGISNIEAVDALRLYELWAEWQGGATPSSVRVGLYDLNSEFDSIETAGLFMNPSHGIGADFAQSGQNGPSIFPNTSLAVRGATTIGAWTFRGAVLDGVPGDLDHADRTHVQLDSDEGALLVGEMNYSHGSGWRMAAGYWQYSAEFDDLTAIDAAGEPARRDDNAGMYALVESPAMFESSRGGTTRVFARGGVAEERINPIRSYMGAGIVRSAVFHESDQLGLAIAVATLGDPYRQALASADEASVSREENVELSYRILVNDWLTLQPDVQYVRHPGMNPEVRDAWLVGLRFELAAGWER